MQKKLIFLRNGRDDFNQIYEYKPLNVLSAPVYALGGYGLKSGLGIDTCPYDIDEAIKYDGYVKTVECLCKQMNVWYTTTCPSILSEHDENFEPMWWNEEAYKWEIYFIEKGKLKNISEFTDKELRPAHNIERLYLNGGLDN